MSKELYTSDLNNIAFDDLMQGSTKQKQKEFLERQADKEQEKMAELQTREATPLMRLRGKPSRNAFDLSCEQNCVIGAPKLITKGKGVLYFEVESRAPAAQMTCARGHSLRLDRRQHNSCDVNGPKCGRGDEGTAFRCCEGCDYDVCQSCWDETDGKNNAACPHPQSNRLSTCMATGRPLC